MTRMPSQAIRIDAAGSDLTGERIGRLAVAACTCSKHEEATVAALRATMAEASRMRKRHHG
jgi:hypothetical protein